MTLPLINGEHAVVAATPRRPPPAPGDHVTLAGTRVLVVDDDPDACDLLETVLRACGAEVHAVQSTRAALAALASFHPDVLMSDIGMPEEDGYALVGQMRAREARSGGHVRAVALTAFASQADREQALAMGFEAHLAKPASPGEVVTTVARLTGRDS
jgi:CheY-like chemotaxis protein